MDYAGFSVVRALPSPLATLFITGEVVSMVWPAMAAKYVEELPAASAGAASQQTAARHNRFGRPPAGACASRGVLDGAFAVLVASAKQPPSLPDLVSHTARRIGARPAVSRMGRASASVARSQQKARKQ